MSEQYETCWHGALWRSGPPTRPAPRLDRHAREHPVRNEATDESRILAVLDPVKQMNQRDVLKAAKIDHGRGVAALRLLVNLGLVQSSTYRVGKRGRPAFLYRRTPPPPAQREPRG